MIKWTALLVAIAALAAAVVVQFLPANSGPLSAATTQADTSQPWTHTITINIAGHPFTLDVVDTDASREKGLMFVKNLPADAGMIFVFPTEKPQTFWMKNTLIPLDVIYVDSAGKVVSFSTMTPEPGTNDDALQRYPSDGPARFAIEVNAGTCHKLGLRIGDLLALPTVVLKPPGQ